MFKNYFVSLSDQFYKQKNDGVLSAPILLKLFLGIPSFSVPIFVLP